MHRHFAIALAFAVGLAAGAASMVLAGAPAQHTAGQTFTMTTDTTGKVIRSSEPQALTLAGDRLSLRVDGRRHGRVVGTLMANVDGKWVEVQFAPQDGFAAR